MKTQMTPRCCKSRGRFSSRGAGLGKWAAFIWILILLGNAGTLSADYKKPRFYIKLTGHGIISKAGDFGDFVDRSEAYYTARNSETGFEATMEKENFFKGFGGEIGLEVEKYAVGIRAGYISSSFDLQYREQTDDTAPPENFTGKYSFSAVPIFLFVHYKLIDKPFLKAFLSLGPGVYLARYKEDLAYVTGSGADSIQTTWLNKCKKNHLGFHAGVTIDVNITRNVALSIDAGYRVAKFDELSGTATLLQDETETVYEGGYYYRYQKDVENGMAEFGVGDRGDETWEERRAEFNLNGFSLSAGIKFIF